MNEFYAAEPTVCDSSAALKLLLGYFGPYAGRYLAAYPVNWVEFVAQHHETRGPVEQERIKTLLRRAKENSAILLNKNLPWDGSHTWLDNAVKLLGFTPPRLSGVIAQDGMGLAHPVSSLSELDIPPTSEERIEGFADEYARVCRTMLIISPELHFIDPYLDLRKTKNKKVMEALLAFLRSGSGSKCKRIVIWARASNFSTGVNLSKTILDDIRNELEVLCRKSGVPPGFVAEYVFVRDEDRDSKMHGRYLLSIRGGVRLDQGFESLPKGRKVDVGPLGKCTHEELLAVYHEGKHDMKIMNQFRLVF